MPFYYKRHDEGRAEPLFVGPFRTLSEARKYVAQALVDNRWAGKPAAASYASSLLPGKPRTHEGSGRAFEIVRQP